MFLWFRLARVRAARREELQRHVAARARIVGAVNRAHAAFTQLRGDLVVRDGFAEQEQVL